MRAYAPAGAIPTCAILEDSEMPVKALETAAHFA